MRAAVWRYEEPSWDEGKWKWSRPARSSTETTRKIRWREEHFEEDKHLWGGYQEAYRTFEEDDDLQGIVLLIEPDQPLRIDGEEHHPVFFDLDNCRDIVTQEIAPWAMEIINALGTYTEVSPSGRGIHAVGLVREPGKERMLVFCTSDGKEFIPKRDLPEDDRDEYHTVEVYGGGVGARHLVTFTGRPLEGYDRPVSSVQEWIDENVPKRDSGRGRPVLDFKDLSPEISGNLKDKVIRICESIKHKGRDDLFKKLYHQGDWSAFPSRSEAEISLLNMLAWATKYLFEDMEEREAVMKGVFQDSEFFKRLV